MEEPQILALCAGYGGLELAVQAGIGGRVVAFAENNEFASRVFSSHHPGVPNIGDITEADWVSVRDEFNPTVITAGFPCRNISNAGDRTGIKGEWSRVWKNVSEAVGVVRPRYVFLENVAAILRRGIDTVVGDLAGIGYDARWTCLRASEPEIGSCHERYRWVCLAYPADADADGFGRHWRSRYQPEQNRRGESADGSDTTSLPTPTARDWKSGASNLIGINARPLNEVVVSGLPDGSWVTEDGRDYGPAVRRWESVLGRPAPSPTEPGTRGNRRLSPVFEEWMMGLPAGWVMDVPDIPRKEQMRMLGNGVVWQQAYEGYSRLFAMETTEMDDMSDELTQHPALKPRGGCTGCAFEYQLGTARSGEFKGELVIRKHNSRTGPGLCSGAQKPPRPAAEEESGPVAELRAAGAFDGDECACGGADQDCPNGCWPVEDAIAHTEGCTEGARFGPSVCTGCDTPGLVQWSREARERDRAEMANHNAAVALAVAPGGVPVFADPDASKYEQDDNPGTVTAVTFADPTPAPAELPPVSGQPEPDRDRWGRYVIGKQSHTRATSFAKLGSSTYALGEWNERMLIKGLVERPDLLALAHGLEVKRDKQQLNQIADDAQTHAGNKVAANIGTAYHAFTERLDAGLITLADVPVQYRARCEQYLNAVRAHGLTTRVEWIERTTAVRADQVSAPAPVAGTLDRIFQLPNGDLVIGDLKTGSDLSYGFVEIAVQLAIYAHGVNTHGLFDWNTKTWTGVESELAGRGLTPVRTDYAIVMHLPADGDGCVLYRVDLAKGWEYAQVSGRVQSRQKDKSVAAPLTVLETNPQPQDTEHMALARELVATANLSGLSVIYDYAVQSGKFQEAELEGLKTLCAARWQGLQVA